MAVQWLKVSDEERKSRKIDYAAVLIGLGAKLFESERVPNSALVALARTDVPCVQVAQKFGYRSIDSLNYLDVPCDVILLEKPQSHGDARVNEFIDTFWKGRIVHEKGYGKEIREIRRAA